MPICRERERERERERARGVKRLTKSSDRECRTEKDRKQQKKFKGY